MEEQKALMVEIVRRPHDDAPRLVLADWLAGRGDPRGELISLQCALASNPETEASYAEMWKREQALLKRHAAEWAAPLEPLAVKPEFSRGLLRTVWSTAAKLLQKKNRKLLDEHLPRLGTNALHIKSATKKVEELAQCAFLQWTPSLAWLDCQLDDAGLAALVSSPHLHNVSELKLEKLRACTDVGLREVAAAELPRLERLQLLAPVHGGRFTAAGVLDVLASERFTITDLTLATAWRVNMGELASGPPSVLSRLRRLTLEIGRDFAPLAECSSLTELRRLTVRAYDHAFDDAMLSAFADNPAYAKLEAFAFRQPAHYAPISTSVIARLQERFGEGLTLL